MKYDYMKQTEKNLFQCIETYYPDIIDYIRDRESVEAAKELKYEIVCELSERNELTGWNYSYYNSKDPLNDMSAKDRLKDNEDLIGKAFAMQTEYQGLDVTVESLYHCDEYEVMDSWIRMYILDKTDLAERVIEAYYYTIN